MILWNEEAVVLMTVRDALEIMEHMPKTTAIYWTAKIVVETFIADEVAERENSR